MAFLLMVLTPLLALLGAGVYALILFWPVMLLLGALHNQVGFEWVPAPGWQTTMLIVALVFLLIPNSANTNVSTSSN